jgi:hypothetical protein
MTCRPVIPHRLSALSGASIETIDIHHRSFLRDISNRARRFEGLEEIVRTLALPVLHCTRRDCTDNVDYRPFHQSIVDDHGRDSPWSFSTTKKYCQTILILTCFLSHLLMSVLVNRPHLDLLQGLPTTNHQLTTTTALRNSTHIVDLHIGGDSNVHCLTTELQMNLKQAVASSKHDCRRGVQGHPSAKGTYLLKLRYISVYTVPTRVPCYLTNLASQTIVSANLGLRRSHPGES